MSDDNEPSQPEQIGASVGVGIESPAKAARGRADEKPAELPARAFLDLLPELVQKRLDRPLHELERHVPREAVADDHVGGVGKQLAALDVPDEVEPARLQEGMGLADEAVPLLRLLADGEEGHGRLRDGEDLLGENGAHVAELDEVLRTRVGVGKPYWPTPAGEFYVRERITGFTDPIYGPLAFGTNARSAVLTDWPGGGFIGIHGTDQPEILPGRVSHGCVRMHNSAVRRLSRLMPLGTPVTIL